MTETLEIRLMTAEEFLHASSDDTLTELVRGKVIVMNRPFSARGYLMMRIGHLLQKYLDTHPLGRVGGGDSGVITERNPDTVRGPDVAFYSYDILPAGSLPDGYWPSPELVIEVRSTDDRWKDVVKKAAEYLNAGVLTVAVVDPQTQRVHLFSADHETAVLNSEDDLSFPDILPGFAIQVKKLFE